MVDESYDPHARMHESFPRVDSGTGTQMAGDVVPLSTDPVRNSQGAIGQIKNENTRRSGGSGQQLSHPNNIKKIF